MTQTDPEQKQKQGKTIKLLFWGLVAPALFFVFMRLFFVFFGFLYTPLISYITGQPIGPVDKVLFGLAAATALVFTVGIIGVIYQQLKKHIIDG
jgi:hypothetical protein